jgi:hypothetical protein
MKSCADRCHGKSGRAWGKCIAACKN